MVVRKTAKKIQETDSDDVNGLVPTRDDTRAKALVFISHDNRDADLAEAFANLLSDISGGTLKSFRSSDKKGGSGIEFGTEWYKAIMSQLGNATDVVALLTHHSIDRPWILYEAGVAKGKLDTNVLGIALGVPLEKVSTGPFGQFQNCGDDEDSLTKLVIQLLQRNPDAAPREEAVRRQVAAFLEGVKKLSAAEGKMEKPQTTDETGIAKLFEEVKAMVRELPERVDDRVRHASRRVPLTRMRRFEPMLFEDFLFHPALKEVQDGPALGWLILLTAIKDDLPWVYEIGLDLYRAMRTRSSIDIAKSRKDLITVVEIISHGPFFHEIMRSEEKDAYFITRRLLEMVDRFIEQMRLPPRPRPRLPQGAEDGPSSKEKGHD